MMFKRFLTAGCLMIAVMAAQARAAIIVQDLNDANETYTLQEVIDAEGIQVGDKLFDEWRVAQGPNAPNASGISVSGFLDQNGDYGLRFNGGWQALTNQIADTTIGFRVTATDPDMYIIANTLKIVAYGADNGGSVGVTENVYEFDPVTTSSDSVADKFVYYVNETNKKTTDFQTFNDPDTGLPVMLKSVWVVKDVVATGGTGTGGIGHLSEFTQSFTQAVPEPASIVLLLTGGALIIGRRRR
jgi:hypothetical protein